MRTPAGRRTPLPYLILVGWFSLALPRIASLPAHAQDQCDVFNVEVTAEDPGAGDLFACALSLSRERTLVVGSVLDDDLGTDSGSLYVFRRQGGGFSQTDKVVASDGAPEHRLGFSVSVDRDGNRFAAGAIFHDGAGQNAGAAYVFRREGGGWVEEARLIPDALGPFDQLGHSIALSGDVLAVGAPGDDTRADAAGTVYVYERGANGWELAAMLTAGQGGNVAENVGDGLGFSVALEGDTLLAGAPFADDGLGAVHVFAPSLEGWQEVQRLTAPERRAGALFGAALALDGDRFAVGARLDDGAGDRAGAVWTFRRVAGQWGPEQQLPAPGLAPGDELGISVALDGNALAVGARFADVGALDTGAVYRYRRRGGLWRFEQCLEAAVPAAGDELGFAVAVEDMELEADDLVVAGAYRADSEAGPDSGLARLRVEAPNANLEISKSDGRETAATGDELVYEIRVRNLGPADFGGAEGTAHVTDSFPGGLAGCSWTCAAAGAGASCGTTGTAGPVRGPIDAQVSLPAGTSVFFEASCTVAAAAGATVTNRARVEPPDGAVDPDPDNNEAVDATRIIGSPERSLLTITKTGPATVEAGSTLPYMVVVTNQGPGPAPDTRVTDDFPALPSEPLMCTWTRTGTNGGPRGPVTGDLDDTVELPANATVTYSVECAVPCNASGTLTNVATADGPDNRVSSGLVRTTVTAADLGVEVLAEPEGLPASTARIVVENRGTAPAVDAVLDLGRTPPVGFTEITDLCDGTFPCSLGALLPGESRQVDLQLTPDCGDPATEVELTAVATSAGACPMTARATEILVLQPVADCPADLRILKTPMSSTVNAGNPVIFTLRVSNDGPETAFNAEVNDLLPPGLAGSSWICTASGGAECGASSGSGDIDEEVTLPPGSSLVYTLQATVTRAPCNTLTNSATVSAGGLSFDPDESDNTGLATVLVTPTNGTCASKTVTPNVQVEGGNILYTIQIFHGGPGTFGGPGPEFEDVVPEELTVVGATADRGTASFVGNTVRWDGTLQAGQTVTLSITATVGGQTLGTEICNQGSILTAQPPLLTDDPRLPGSQDPTCFFVVAIIPTLSPVWMALLTILLATLGLAVLHRRKAAVDARNGSTSPRD